MWLSDRRGTPTLVCVRSYPSAPAGRPFRDARSSYMISGDAKSWIMPSRMMTRSVGRSAAASRGGGTGGQTGRGGGKTGS
ncbi:hypothetical protein Tco_1442607 [Tanacetum coccineum]